VGVAAQTSLSVGNPSRRFQYLFLNSVGAIPAAITGHHPQGAFMVYQLMFAIITPRAVFFGRVR
jgi:ammonia channel protein AmtB